MPKYFYQLLRRIKQSHCGAMLVYFALILPLVAGFAGLGFDATMWYMQKRQLQSAADSAAITAAYALSKDQTFQEVVTAAAADANKNKSQNGANQSISVITPPTSGPFSGSTKHVSISLTLLPNMLFTKMLGLNDTRIVADATAAILDVGEHCILALDETRHKALEFTGTSNVDINCGVASNSNSSESIYLNGTATLSANPSAQSFGDIFQGSNATLDTPNPIQPFSQRSPDPYGPDGRDIQVPLLPAACTETGNTSIKSTDPDPVPGRYCGDLKFSAHANATLSAGIYIVDDGDFEVAGNAAITGDDVTIVLTADNAADIGTVKINGGATVTLKAPNYGPYAGIVFFQDPRAVYENGSNSFLGGSSMNIKGAVYFPSQELRYSGGSSSSSGCLQLVGSKVTFSGNSVLYNDQSDCDFVGIEKIARTLVTLVE